MDQKNLILSNYDINEVNDLPSDEEKIKHIVSYLEDVNALLIKQQEMIKSLLASNETTTDRLDSHADHLKSHDQHLAAHDKHLELLSKR